MSPLDRTDRAARLRIDRRAQILEVAKQVFAELGYHSASVSAIIERTGIARGTFYLYFSNKRKVFDAILGEALEQLSRRIRVIRLDPGAPPPRAQLRASLIEMMTYLLDDRPLTQLLLNHGLTPDAESAERVEAFYGHVTAVIRSSLRQGIAMGLVRDCPTELVAAGLFGAVRGIVMYMVSVEEPKVDDIVDGLIDMALLGVTLPERWREP